MAEYDRNKIKKEIYEKLKKRVKREVLEKNIDSLVEERIDILETVRKTRGEDLPSKSEMKWWFQDRPLQEEVEVSPNVFETVYEIKIDDICMNDKVALEVFKSGYKIKYEAGKKLHPLIKEFLSIYKIIEYSKSKSSKSMAMKKLNNIALVGVTRYYNLIKKPYFTESQMTTIIEYFIKSIKLIYDIENGKHKDKNIQGGLYIFEALGDKSN